MPRPLGLTELATVLATTDATPEPAFRYIYENPAEAVNLEDFPIAVICLMPGAEQAWRMESMGQPGEIQHDYVAAVYVLLGMMGTGLEELHERAALWPQALAVALAAHLKLGQARIVKIGYREDNKLFTYKMGPIEWGKQIYFGLTLTVPMRELIRTPVGA